MGFISSESCGSFERSCQSIPQGPPPALHSPSSSSPALTLAAGCGAYINAPRRSERHRSEIVWGAHEKMPASQSGFGNFFLERSISMPAGYQIPVLGCPPGVQQQQHLAALAAGVPVTYSGLQGYNFIPYPHHRPITHMVS